jgi:hypothetical protein
VRVCPNCGEENSDRAKFCQNCAQPLEQAARARESRKVVTVLFSDVTGSTSLGEQLDPESLRHVLRMAGKTEEAAGALGRALELYEAKGNVVMADRVRRELSDRGEPDAS